MVLFPSCNPTGSIQPCTIDSIFQLLFNVYNYLLGAAAAVCILMIIIGGIAFMLGGSEEATKWGKAALKNALIGLALVLLSYLIIKALLGALGATVDLRRIGL